MKLTDSITELKGVGPKKEHALKHLGISTIEDLIFCFPKSYEDRRNTTAIGNLKPGTTAVFRGMVTDVRDSAYVNRRRSCVIINIADATGVVRAVFFNNRYVKESLQRGKEFTFFGTPVMNRGRMQIVQPEFDVPEKMPTGILPVYPLTRGITQKDMRRFQREAAELYGEIQETLREDILRKHNTCGIEYAIRNIHFPQEKKKLLESRYRLIFEEFMALETGMMIAGSRETYVDAEADLEGKKQDIDETGRIRQDEHGFAEDGTENEFVAGLPYELTEAQLRCLREIIADLERPHPMNRLLQGDVGSGKTVLAEAALYKTVKNGFQGIIMAPTEILARQHYEGFRKSLGAHGIKVALLSGSMKTSERKQVLEEMSDGTAQVIVGTHALISDDVEYQNPGLVITDEQHRFGVKQRARLRKKGKSPNTLVMTATPIPRTLAVVLYGDMDVSVIDTMPEGRLPVKTFHLKDEKSRFSCYEFVQRQVSQGHQAYVVAPLIEESEAIDARSAVQVYEELSEKFGRTALLHGDMKQSEKDAIMEDFYQGRTDVLVATVVIEVGINVPNATVMVVENAERFGLAQLHQLRGRVGRGDVQSYCFLISSGNSEIAMKRGDIMEKSSDGFFIAEEDLKMRGPGEIFGTRQHGLPDLRLADMARHMDILCIARDEAKAIVTEDPHLKRKENRAIRRRVERMFGEDISLNL